MFTNRDRGRFDQFRRALRDLRARAMVQEWPRRLSVDLFGIESTHLQGVDEDHLRAFLIALRQFTNKNEATYFFSICSILHRGSTSPTLHRWVDHSRAAWRASLKSSAGICLNGKVFALEEILKLLLYGVMVHRDTDKLARLDAMHEQDRAVLRLMLIQLVPALLQALNIVDHLVHHVQEDRVHEPPELGEQPTSGSTTGSS